MSATSPSNYEVITIQSADDPERTVDLRAGILGINYYESILSSSISMKLACVDTAESIEDPKTGRFTTIYQGLPLRGGERVFIQVKANTPTNIDLRFIDTPLVVRGISNANFDGETQLFTLDLVPISAIINEVNFVEKVYQQQPIDQIVADILTTKLNLSPFEYHIDGTAGPIGFSGNLMKPYKCLNMLASKAISSDTSASNKSAGFFCYQTRRGMTFCSIDTLCAQSPKAEYLYTEVNENKVDFEPSPDLPSLDRKIVSFSVIKNQDIIGNLKTGAYATRRQFFNPVTQQVTFPEQGNFSSIDYGNDPNLATLGAQPLGEDIFKSAPDGASDQIKQYFNRPSRILNGVMPIGTYASGVSKEMDEDPLQIEAQRAVRYNTLFSQALQVLIPLNSKLHAGDVIGLKIPQQTNAQTGEIDTEISGNYLIKDICHSYNADGSYSSLKVVRDTYGKKVNRN